MSQAVRVAVREVLTEQIEIEPPWLTRFARSFSGGIRLSVMNKDREIGYFKAQWPALAMIVVLLVAWWNTYSSAKEREVQTATNVAIQMATISQQVLALEKLLNVRNQSIEDLNKKIDTNEEDIKVAQDTIQQLRVENARRK